MCDGYRKGDFFLYLRSDLTFHMGLSMRKPTIWVLTRSDTNHAVQSKRKARCLKFGLEVEEELYYPWSENKGATAKLICVFVFAYANYGFSHAMAHIKALIMLLFIV